MVQRTAMGLPYIEPTDTPITYPTTNQELVTDLEKALNSPTTDAGFSVTGSGSGISTFLSVGTLILPRLLKLSISWTHGSTSVPAGDNTFWVGTVGAAYFPKRITTGTLRKNAGAGICQISSSDGQLQIKWLSSSLASGHTVYVDFLYELATPAFPIALANRPSAETQPGEEPPIEESIEEPK